MALTDSEVFYLRTKIGTADPPSDATLFDNYVRLGYSLDAVAREILETRRADLLNAPDSFTVVGEYSQSTDKQITGIDSVLATLGGTSELGEATLSITDPAAPNNR